MFILQAISTKVVPVFIRLFVLILILQLGISVPTQSQADTAGLQDMSQGLDDFTPDQPEKPLDALVPNDTKPTQATPAITATTPRAPTTATKPKVAATVSTPSVPANWQHHTIAGLVVSVPPDWTIIRKRSDKLQIGNLDKATRKGVMLMIGTQRKNPLNEKKPKEMKITTLKNRELAGHIFTQEIMQADLPQAKMYAHMFFSKNPYIKTKYSSNFLVITLGATNLDPTDYKETFVTILNSIRAATKIIQKPADPQKANHHIEKTTEELPSKPEKSYYNGSIDGKLQADIDKDGKSETVLWKKFSTTELGDYYQLMVLDDDGSLLWEGPKKVDDTDPLVFYALDTGVSLPQVLVDFDLDGNIELLAPMAQSDVSPTYYRKLRWRGDHFEPLLQSALMFDTDSSNRFIWKQAMGAGGTWVSKLSRTKRGEILAEITQLRDYGGVDMGEVSIVFDTKGAIVKRVLRPPAKVGGDTVTSPFEGNPSANSVAQVPAPKSNTYQAKISDRDHYNSRGIRLRNLASVLRQDRANYYKYGGDRRDQPDRYFSSIDNRKAMERIAINPVGISYRALKDLIVYGTPLLKIEIEQSRLNVRVIER